MPTWLYLLIIGLVFLLMMRGGCGSHVMGHRHGRHGSSRRHDEGGARTGTPMTSVDPVCGMTVDTTNAKSTMHEGRAYFFCSAQCRDRFEKAPESFVKTDKEGTQPMENHHG